MELCYNVPVSYKSQMISMINVRIFFILFYYILFFVRKLMLDVQVEVLNSFLSNSNELLFPFLWGFQCIFNVN